MADNAGMGTRFQTKSDVYIKRSLNTQAVKTYQESIELKIAEEDGKKTRKSTFLRAISSLLDELLIRKVMTFEECFRFYSSYIKDITQLSESVIYNAKQSFQDKILGYEGLPVILVKTGNIRFFLLVENGVNDAICNGLQDIIESSIEQLQYTILNKHLKSIAIVYKNLMSLASTNKDRYLLVYILSRMFSKTGLKHCLDLNPDFVDKVQEQVQTLLWSIPDKIGEFEADAKKQVEQTVSNLKQVINEKTEILTKRRKRLSENLISDCEYEIANKKQKLERLNIPINNMANPTESKHSKSSGPSSICTGNSHEILMEESDKICSEQKQENTRVPQHVLNDTATLPLHNEVLSISNEYPLVNVMNNHKDELIIIQDSQRQDQIQNDSVCLQDLAGDNEINDVNEVEPQLKTKHPKEKSCIVLIGDSIIKHIDPKKLSKNKVYKYTYPGGTAESIATKVCALKPQIAPSHVIIHAGTNNIPTDTAGECAQKIVNLAGKLKEKFPNSKIGLSSIIQRQDIQMATKIDEANKILKQKCMDIGMSFIDNYTLDSTCLNGSNIHLNAKGSAILATKFITFLRGNKSSKTSHYHEDFPLTTLHQLGNLLRTIGIFPVHKYQKKKRR